MLGFIIFYKANLPFPPLPSLPRRSYSSRKIRYKVHWPASYRNWLVSVFIFLAHAKFSNFHFHRELIHQNLNFGRYFVTSIKLEGIFHSCVLVRISSTMAYHPGNWGSHLSSTTQRLGKVSYRRLLFDFCIGSIWVWTRSLLIMRKAQNRVENTWFILKFLVIKATYLGRYSNFI